MRKRRFRKFKRKMTFARNSFYSHKAKLVGARARFEAFKNFELGRWF